MHALLELWWQLAVTLNLELNVTQGAWRAFLRELGLFWEKLTPVRAWFGVKHVGLENWSPAFPGSCISGRGSGLQMTVCVEV